MTKLRILLTVMLLVVLALVVYKSFFTHPPRAAHQSISLRQEWIPQMTFTGEVVAKTKNLFGPNLDIEIRSGGFESDPIKSVALGGDTFGVAGAERVLQAIEKGADLVVIGVVNQVSPSVFVVHENSSIMTPKDFEGHTVGVLSGSNTEIAYRAMVARAGVDSSKMHEVEISYDLPGFISKKFDVLPAFAYDEPLSLRQENVDIRLIEPEKFGIKIIGNVYFTTRKTFEGNRSLVDHFVKGIMQGWEWAFEHPEESIEMLRELDPKLDLAKERESLLLAKPYFIPEGYRLLEIRKSDWEEEARLLQSIGYLDKTPDLNRALAPQIVEAAYSYE